jgi:Fe-S-cluster containining protein
LSEALDQIDLDAYFDDPSSRNVPLTVKTAIWRGLKEGFESANKIFGAVGGCQCCGNCCRETPVEITPTEIARIARFLNLGVKETFNKFAFWYESTTEIYLKTPCPFLNDKNKCSIYPARPLMCKFYPIRPTEFWFTIVNNPNCPLSQTILQFNKKYVNSPEVKKAFEQQLPEIKQFFQQAIKESAEAESDKHLPAGDMTPVECRAVSREGIACFADWLEKQKKEG